MTDAPDPDDRRAVAPCDVAPELVDADRAVAGVDVADASRAN